MIPIRKLLCIILFLSGAVIGFVLLYPHIKPLIERYIVLPVLYGIGYFRFYIESIPQVVFWIAAIVVTLIMAGFALNAEEQPSDGKHERKGADWGRIAANKLAIENALKHDYSRSRFAAFLARLTLAIHRVDSGPSRIGLSSDKIESIIREHQLSVPPYIVDNLKREEMRDFSRHAFQRRKNTEKQLDEIEEAVLTIEKMLKENSGI